MANETTRLPSKMAILRPDSSARGLHPLDQGLDFQAVATFVNGILKRCRRQGRWRVNRGAIAARIWMIFL